MRNNLCCRRSRSVFWKNFSGWTKSTDHWIGPKKNTRLSFHPGWRSFRAGWCVSSSLELGRLRALRMERYRFLDHTADAKFQAFGNTLEEAFSNAALATASLMWDWERIEKKVELQVEVQGRDLKQLLCSFLEEIVYLLDSRSFLLGVPERVRLDKKGGLFTLKALFKGDEYSEKYEIHGDVKAITYDEMEIVEGDRFMVQVVVDI